MPPPKRAATLETLTMAPRRRSTIPLGQAHQVVGVELEQLLERPTRLAILARVVRDWDFAAPAGARNRIHGAEQAMRAIIERSKEPGVVDLECAPEITEFAPGSPPHDEVGQPGRNDAQPRVLAVNARAADHIVSLIVLSHQQGNLLGGQLQIAVHECLGQFSRRFWNMTARLP